MDTKKHRHHGKSSQKFLDDADVLSRIGLFEGATFLDAGCGDGFFSIAASSRIGNNGKVYAIDIYEESINNLQNEILAKSIRNMEAIVADITHKIPLPDESVDICFMANVLHGFVENQELDSALSEITRVIKPGGIFAVVEFKKIERTFGPPMEIRLDESDINDILIDYGFSSQSSCDIGDYHFLVKYIKK
jgi:ubiquinone/menaquinone biosynthesis C-methylase UbiE